VDVGVLEGERVPVGLGVKVKLGVNVGD